jgi:hypothetical protein
MAEMSARPTPARRRPSPTWRRAQSDPAMKSSMRPNFMPRYDRARLPEALPACAKRHTPSLLTTLYRHREDSMLSMKRWECYHRLLGD